MVDTSFQGRLLPGERIAWSGRPGQGLLFSRADLFLVPFSLLWCGFAIFWTFTVSQSGGPGFMTLWGLMFVCIGLYFVAGRLAVDAWARGKTHYAVTDRRILIARDGPFSKFIAITLAGMPDADIDERSDGRGTIRFGHQNAIWGNRGSAVLSPAFDPTPQFIAIDDARRVFDLIQRTIQKSA